MKKFNLILRSLFIFSIVWLSYRGADFCIEGYHDIAIPAGASLPDEVYIIDLISPIWFVPEIVAFLLGSYALLLRGVQNSVITSIFYVFGTLIALSLLYCSYHVYQVLQCLDGYRESNMYNYIGTVIALFIGLVPWIHKLKQTLSNNKSAQPN